MSRIQYWNNPSAAQCGDSVEAFLHALAQPTCILIDGVDNSRTRALVTLIHGNEPSGVMALHRWLREGRQPAVKTVCLVVSVQAALRAPLFSHRVLPGLRDLNRCFRAPFDDSQGELAADILEVLREFRPEAIIDLHNTSGSGPSFGVATFVDQKHEALVSLFSRCLITNDLRMGALMEIAENLFPTVTIECGGRLDAAAHSVAADGLRRFFETPELFPEKPQSWGIEVLRNPLRLELVENCRLAYADTPQAGYDLTLKTDIDQYNFGALEAGIQLGWVGERALDIFIAKDPADAKTLRTLVTAADGALLTARAVKLFMITTNPVIAKMDCVCYALGNDSRGVMTL